MEHYSIQDRVFLVQSYYKSNDSLSETLRKWSSRNKNRPKPDPKTVKRLVDKFERTGSVADDPGDRANRSNTARTPEIIEKAKEIMKREPSLSTRKLAQELGLSYRSAGRILKDDLKLFPYKLQVYQRLSEVAITKRFNFAADILELVDTKQIDLTKIIFSDEAHFWLDGYVNNQNFRIWGSEKPALILTKPLHPKKLTVWMAMSADKMVGPFFFEGTVDSASYNHMMTYQFLPTAREIGWTKEHYFQQDGAPPHVTRENLTLLHEAFGQRVISRSYPETFGYGMAWPPYSPDLSPLDFFLWGYIKDKVYKNRPKTLDELKQAVMRELRSVPAESCRRTIGSFEKRLRYVITVDGGHVENVLS